MARRRWKIEDIKAVVAGEQPFIQSGYTNPQHHKVGDEWVDAKGVKWKKTASGVHRVNEQMDAIRELIRPRCKKCNMDVFAYGDKLDKKVHPRTGLCFDCLQAEEMLMRVDAPTWDKYQDLKMTKNRLALLKEFRSKVVETIDYLKKDDAKLQFVHSNGSIETWSGAMNAELLKEAEADLVKTDEEIVKVEAYLATINI